MGATLRWNGREEEGERIRHQLGVFAMARGDLENAQRHLRAVGEGASSASLRGESLLYRGILHLEREEVEDAHHALTEALRLQPESSAIRYHLGRCEFSWKDFIAASDRFHEALDLGISIELEGDLRLYLGICHIRLEEFAEALAALEGASIASAPVWFYRGVALMGLARFPEAMERLRLALERDPAPEDIPPIHLHAGQCLKEMAQWEPALVHLRQCLAADPRTYEAWNLLGYCLFRSLRHHEAIEAFLKALEIRPRSAIDYANVGSNLRDLGDPAAAAEWYGRALKLDPTLGFAAENLMRIEENQRSEVGSQKSD
jgi:tetratricopeptide (TPR) repeat protein